MVEFLMSLCNYFRDADFSDIAIAKALRKAADLIECGKFHDDEK